MISKTKRIVAMLGATVLLSACAAQQAPEPYAPVVAVPYESSPRVAVVPEGASYRPPVVVYAPRPYYDRPEAFNAGFGVATLNAWSRDNFRRYHRQSNRARRRENLRSPELTREERRALRRERRAAGSEPDGERVRRIRTD